MTVLDRICEFFGFPRRVRTAHVGRKHFMFVLPANTSEEQRERFTSGLKSLRHDDDIVIYGGVQVFEL